MKKYIEDLKKCPLFYHIDEESLLRMLVCLGARIEHYDKKHTIFSEGREAKTIGVLLSGSAQVIRIDYMGNRSILNDIEKYELFGEDFACAEVDQMPVSIVAGEPCIVMLIDCSHILHTCQNNCGFHQQLIYNLMRSLATKNLFLHQKSDITSKRTTREKLLTYLDYQAQRAGADSFKIPFDRQELADYLEVERSGLSVEIGKLKKEGIIDAHKNSFTLL